MSWGGQQGVTARRRTSSTGGASGNGARVRVLARGSLGGQSAEDEQREVRQLETSAGAVTERGTVLEEQGAETEEEREKESEGSEPSPRDWPTTRSERRRGRETTPTWRERQKATNEGKVA